MSSNRARETIGAAVLVALGVGVRWTFCAAFPTEPQTDFRGLVIFGLRLRDEGLAVPGYHWVQFNSGLPLLLAGLFRVFPRHVAVVARVATGVATGLVPLLPYVLWRAVLSWRTRVLAGLLLALWPGLVFFSGVVASENWVILPSVALAGLAVRRLRDPDDDGHPITSGLLFAAAIAIRQEMAVVLIPPALAAAGLPGRRVLRGARLLRLAAALAIPLVLLAAQRRAATGRFAVTTEHGGMTVLGALAPGSAAAGWVPPKLFIASIEPDLLRQPDLLVHSAGRLAIGEFSRRYRYHLFRSAAAAARLAVESDAQNLFWPLEAPGVLDPAHAARGAAFARGVRPWLRWELALLSGFFLAALAHGLLRRDAALLVVASTVVLRLIVQVAFSPIGRLAIPGIALALLAVALAVDDLDSATAGRRARFLGVGLATAVLLIVAEPRLVALAVAKDEAPRSVRRFPMLVAGAGGAAFADCEVESGRLNAISSDRAWVGPAPDSPDAPFRTSCRLPEGLPDGTLGLDLESAARGLVVEADGQARGGGFDLPDPGWRRLEIAEGSARPRSVVIRGPAAVGSSGFGFVLVRRGAAPLPRHRDLP